MDDIIIMKKLGRQALIVLPFVIALAVFAADLRVPMGWSVWLLYGVPVLIASSSPRPRSVFLLAAVCTAFIAVDYVYSTPGADQESVIFNRFWGAVMIWVTALITFSYRRTVDALRLAQAALAAHIEEREIYLNRTNEHLQQERAEHRRTQDKLRACEGRLHVALHQETTIREQSR